MVQLYFVKCIFNNFIGKFFKFWKKLEMQREKKTFVLYKFESGKCEDNKRGANKRNLAQGISKSSDETRKIQG